MPLGKRHEGDRTWHCSGSWKGRRRKEKEEEGEGGGGRGESAPIHQLATTHDMSVIKKNPAESHTLAFQQAALSGGQRLAGRFSASAL